jgi:GAF domain-containing protein
MTAFAELGRIPLADNDLTGVLGKVAHLAVAAIAGADAVAVTLVLGGVASTAAHTGAVALALDERQYDAGYGPCLDAARDQTVYLVRDNQVEKRWPAFRSAAADHGVRSTLSVGIPVRDTVTGALNIYGFAADAFDDDAVAMARTFAGYAAVALANAHLYETTSALAEQMAEAMASRAVIEQAKGVLIAQQQVTPEEAFAILSRASQTANRKLRDIAQAIVDGAAGSH